MLFIKIKAPLNPDEIIRGICRDAKQHRLSRSCRHVRRVTPATIVGKATGKGLEEVATEVLRPVFHDASDVKKKV